MFKLWIYTFFSTSASVLVFPVLFYRNVILFFIYSELFWMFTYNFTLFLASHTCDPVYIFLGFLVLYIAAIEVVLLGIILSSHVK